MKNRIKKSITQTPPNRQVSILCKATNFLLILLLLTATACQRKNPISTHLQVKRPVLVVHLNDYSMSSAPISYFDSNNAKELYNTVADFGGTVKHIGIYAESQQQDIYTLNVKSLDTVNTSEITNVYIASKTKAKNSKAVLQFQQQAKMDIASYVSKISCPQTEKHTDLANAFQLAAVTLGQGNFSAYDKYLLVTSDLNDCPKKGKPRLRPLQLSNTAVLLVRPALTDTVIKHLFPSSAIHVFTSTSDAISFISQNQNQ